MVKAYYYTVVLCLGFLYALPSQAEATFSFVKTPGELPKEIIPSEYKVSLKLDPHALILQGHETVIVHVMRSSRQIVLNQAGLNVTRAALDRKKISSIVCDDKKQTVTLRFRHSISTGKHIIKLDYRGAILTTPNGLYSNDYRREDGTYQRMLVTQFEVADARRMLPVWDEPAFKARFTLKVTLPASYLGISNMPLTKTQNIGAGWKTLFFQRTPRMSSYLLAFVAGDMKALHSQREGTDLGVYAPSGKEEQGRYALNTAYTILPYYNEYFGVNYPLPKMDMIAVPGNYQAGAMENWGALTYIDNDLLFDEHHSTFATKELIYEVVAHEMAHQWSGDLVTMGWWNDLWLNEGFASWMEIKATDKFNPSWDLWTRQHQIREQTMQRDALSMTHPIQQTIHNIDEAQSVFDDISYGKGELVIRMLEGWLGEDAFRDGMRRYMRAHAYSNATSQDLWNALTAATGQNIAQVAKSFTEQKGIPQLNVALKCVDHKAVYTLTQQRFVVHDLSAQAQFWHIPIVVGGPSQPKKKMVVGAYPVRMTTKSCQVPLSFNWGESGYYRVRYNKPALTLLREHLTEFPAVDRANILGDQYALFEADRRSLSDYLADMEHLLKAGEYNSVVLEEVLTRLNTLNRYEQGQLNQAIFQQRARSLLLPSLERLGWEKRDGESVLDTMLRPRLIMTLGLLDEPSVLQEISKRFIVWMDNPTQLSAELVGPVVSLAMRHADQTAWNRVVQRVQQADSTEVRLRLFEALSYSSNPALIEQTVRLAYSGVISNGRINRVLVMLAIHSTHPEKVWRSIILHKNDIRQHLTPEAQNVFLANTAAEMLGVQTTEDLESDLKHHSTRGTQIAISKSFEISAAQESIKKRAISQIDYWIFKRK